MKTETDEKLEIQTTGDFVQDCSNCHSLIDGNAHALARIANAFAITGNARLADRLFEMSDELKAIAEMVLCIRADKITAEMRDSQQRLGETFNLILNAATR